MNITKNKTILELIKVCVALAVIGMSQNTNSQIVNANFNWSGSNNYSVIGNFTFDNDISFMNQVSEDNGALKYLSWSAFSNGIEVYTESVVSNSAINFNNHLFNFDYDVASNNLVFIDTGASESWFTNNLIYPNNFFTSVLQLNDDELSSNEQNAKVSLDNTV